MHGRDFILNPQRLDKIQIFLGLALGRPGSPGDGAGLLAATPNGVYVGGATRRVALRATCG